MKKEDGYREAASKVVDGLRNNAFTVAQEIGLDRILEPDGTELLCKAMKAVVLPLTEREANIDRS